MPGSRARSQLRLIVALMALSFVAGRAHSLPLGFGVNQGSLDYREIHDDYIYLYHDARAPNEGRALLNAMVVARPTLEKWFDEKRERWIRSGERRLPVIVSAVTANASFANLIFDAIELQTLGTGDRDLAWHEYVHSMMYQKFENVLGPAGSALHIFFMPAWFIEGLADAMSVSVGSDTQAGIERFQALTGKFPKFDRIHSLYTESNSEFGLIGYATSGAFTAYILRQYDANRLAESLDYFYWHSMPWWWWGGLYPFRGFGLFDDALEKLTNDKNAEQLYEEYKKAAKEHWVKNSAGRFLATESGSRRFFNYLDGIEHHGNELTMVTFDDDGRNEARIEFDDDTGWAKRLRSFRKLPDKLYSFARVTRGNSIISVGLERNVGVKGSSLLQVSSTKNRKAKTLLKRNGQIEKLWDGGKNLVWLERDIETHRLCLTPMTKVLKRTRLKDSDVNCFIEHAFPTTLEAVGADLHKVSKKRQVTKSIVLRRSVQTAVGDRHELIDIDLRNFSQKTFRLDDQARPMSVVRTKGGFLVLAAERSRRVVRLIDDEGACKLRVPFDDHILSMHGTDGGHLVLGLYAGYTRLLRKLKIADLKGGPCKPSSGHSSPLIVAVRTGNEISLAEAMQQSSIWADNESLAAEDAKGLAERAPLDEEIEATKSRESKPARYRAAPAFFVPWIGGNDPTGYQIGFISVPLIDDLQNERVDYTVLVGVNSLFPAQQVSLTSYRFPFDLKLTVYREQKWNGTIFDRVDRIRTSIYDDEKGGRLEVRDAWRVGDSSHSVGMTFGIKRAHRRPYLVIRPGLPEGNQTSFALRLSLGLAFEWFNWSTYGESDVSPEFANESYVYDKLEVGTTFSKPIFGTSLQIGIEGSRTRGEKQPILKEIYQPLRTFIPGSGGGINQGNLDLPIGDGSLFSIRYGDNQARFKTNWIVPVVRDFETVFWTFYLQRLDLSLFYNKGNAWRGAYFEDLPEEWIDAVGGNLDLQAENRGFTVSLGIGSGKVIGQDQQYYVRWSFDQFF